MALADDSAISKQPAKACQPSEHISSTLTTANFILLFPSASVSTVQWFQASREQLQAYKQPAAKLSAQNKFPALACLVPRRLRELPFPCS
jgi:hypothetical protein